MASRETQVTYMANAERWRKQHLANAREWERRARISFREGNYTQGNAQMDMYNEEMEKANSI